MHKTLFEMHFIHSHRWPDHSPLSGKLSQLQQHAESALQNRRSAYSILCGTRHKKSNCLITRHSFWPNRIKVNATCTNGVHVAPHKSQSGFSPNVLLPCFDTCPIASVFTNFINLPFLSLWQCCSISPQFCLLALERGSNDVLSAVPYLP